MILTVTLNPAIDKVLVLNGFEIHKLHRLNPEELSMTVPGGKGVNIALTLNLLGNDVVATGFAGGYEGHMLCDYLRQSGVTTSFIFADSSTRTNISILDMKNETLTEVNDHGQFIPTDDLEFFIENYARLLHKAEMVVLAGSLPEGVPDDIYHKLIEMTKKHDVKIILHTSSTHLEHIHGFSPFLINPDMRSSHVLFGKPIDGIDQFIETGKKMLEKYKDTEFVIFTHRIENVVAITRDKSYIMRPQQLKIINMLGYGDAYLAGFIHAFAQKLPTIDVLKYASAAGLTNVESLMKVAQETDKIKDNINRIKVEER